VRFAQFLASTRTFWKAFRTIGIFCSGVGNDGMIPHSSMRVAAKGKIFIGFASC
jgi:hypothetical protein